MGNLSRCAKAAKTFGLSYGMYMALDHEQKMRNGELSAKKMEENRIRKKLDSGWKYCDFCGELFFPKKWRKVLLPRMCAKGLQARPAQKTKGGCAKNERNQSEVPEAR